MLVGGESPKPIEPQPKLPIRAEHAVTPTPVGPAEGGSPETVTKGDSVGLEILKSVLMSPVHAGRIVASVSMDIARSIRDGIARITAAFMDTFFKETPVEQLNAAAYGLKLYFEDHSEWFDYKNNPKIFAEPDLRHPQKYESDHKENIQERLMAFYESPDNQTLVKGMRSLKSQRVYAKELPANFPKSNNANLVADILKDLYKEMKILDEQNVRNIGTSITQKELTQGTLDPNIKDHIDNLINGLSDDKRLALKDFIGLLAKVNKNSIDKNQRPSGRLDALASMAAKVLCEDTMDSNVAKVTKLMIKHYDELFPK